MQEAITGQGLICSQQVWMGRSLGKLHDENVPSMGYNRIQWEVQVLPSSPQIASHVAAA